MMIQSSRFKIEIAQILNFKYVSLEFPFRFHPTEI